MPQEFTRLHDLLAQPRPPIWGRVSVWMVLGVILMASAILFSPRDGRGRGVHFSYAVFADGRRVPSWVSSDATGAGADVGFFATIWSTEVLGFRRWRCDVATGDRLHGPIPPNGMTAADMDALRRDGCAHVIAACRGDDWEQFVFDKDPNVPLSEDIPALELMAQGGGFGCGGGLRGWVGEAMHRMEHWVFRASIACFALGVVFSTLQQGLRRRLQHRLARAADWSLCPACEYPLQPGPRCPECGIDTAAEVQRCQLVLAGPVRPLAPTGS